MGNYAALFSKYRCVMDKYSCYWLGITPAMTLYSVVIYHYFSKVGSVSSGILHKLLMVKHYSWKFPISVDNVGCYIAVIPFHLDSDDGTRCMYDC